MERIGIGVLGGTFDPPHNGHLAIATAALDHLKLQRVLFAPTRQPPHKPNQPITPVARRVEMVRLAIAEHSGFVLSRVDVDRTGPTYTVDTLRQLRQEWGEETPLYFIMGMDSLVNLPTWYKPEELLALCRLAVLERPGYKADLENLETRIPGIRERVVFVPAPPVDISATDIQRRVREGDPIAGLVPPAVAAYIRERGLYRDSVE
jgi:nicotinate-nucleotide adenylyltransferase